MRILVAVMWMFSGMAAAAAAEIRVFSTPTLKAAFDDITPAFERASGHRLILRFDGVPVLKREIEMNVAFDVAILVPSALDDLTAQGKIAAGGRMAVARTLTGIAVRAGAGRLVLTTVDDVKRTMLAASRVAYSPDSVSGTAFLALLRKLDIEAVVQPKLVQVSGRSPVAAVASGEADLTVITVPNIVGVAGVELGGVLPEALQTPTVFSAGVSAASAAGPGLELIAFMRGAAAVTALRGRGFEAAGP